MYECVAANLRPSACLSHAWCHITFCCCYLELAMATYGKNSILVVYTHLQ